MIENLAKFDLIIFSGNTWRNTHMQLSLDNFAPF